MTLEEAQIVANIVAHADGGCSNCVREMLDLLNARFPAFHFAFGGSEILEYSEYDPEWPSRYPGVTVTEKVAA